MVKMMQNYQGRQDDDAAATRMTMARTRTCVRARRLSSPLHGAEVPLLLLVRTARGSAVRLGTRSSRHKRRAAQKISPRGRRCRTPEVARQTWMASPAAHAPSFIEMPKAARCGTRRRRRLRGRHQAEVIVPLIRGTRRLITHHVQLLARAPNCSRRRRRLDRLGRRREVHSGVRLPRASSRKAVLRILSASSV